MSKQIRISDEDYERLQQLHLKRQYKKGDPNMPIAETFTQVIDVYEKVAAINIAELTPENNRS